MPPPFTGLRAGVLAVVLAGLLPGLSRAADPASASQAQLLATLTSNAPLDQKWAAAQQLAQTGTREAVPKLAALLTDDQLSDLARSVLESIPDPAVDVALRDVLDRLEGTKLAGVITTIGARRDAEAVAALARRLPAKDPVVVSAAADALGRIGTPPAAKALEEAIPAASAAQQRELYANVIQCADTLQAGAHHAEAAAIYRRVAEASSAPAAARAAAVRGALLAGDTAGLTLLMGQLESLDPAVFTGAIGLVQQDLPGPAVSAALAAEWAKLPPERQVPLIQALGMRTDAEARHALGQAARAGQPAVRLAALGAMTSNPEFVPTLVELARDADPALAKAAQASLASVPGAAADAAVLSLLDNADASARLAGMQTAARRRLLAAVPKLIQLAGGADAAQSGAALTAAGGLVGTADVPSLLSLLSGTNALPDRGLLERALAGACARATNSTECVDPILGQLGRVNPADRCLLLRVLGVAGGAQALQAVSAAVRDANREIRTTAIHTLSLWHNLEAATVLLDLATTLADRADRLVCLRGYLGMAANEDLPTPQRLELCRRAATLCQAAPEQKLLLSAVGGIPAPASLALAVPALADPATRREAGAAVLAVVAAILDSPPAAAQVPALIDPLYQVTQFAPTPDLAGQAKALLKRAFQVHGPRGNGPGPVTFVKHRIGTFRSEACGVADFNSDGKLDVVAGEYLYLAPDWKPVKIRSLKGSVGEQGKGYRWDFANLPLAIAGTGKPDLISVDWFDKHAVWFRNEGVGGAAWPETLIDINGNFEMAHLEDVIGDGKALAVIPAVTNTIWYELVKGADGKGAFAKHIISGKAMNWGVGVGDINGDGRPDFIRPDAWFEAPADPRHGQWIEHPLALGGLDGKADHTPQILVYDVNGDGLNDIITSSAHGYGIFWYEQIREGKAIKFRQHLIDESWTQAHSLALADLDGCGVPELITGKRFMAHNGGDPDEAGPLGVYYYKLSRLPLPVWTKHVISFDEAIGSGVNLCVADMDGDGDLDIVVTGKWGGPVWFENQRLPSPSPAKAR